MGVASKQERKHHGLDLRYLDLFAFICRAI
uniref:Uncharacterized protein n=1 Tax=Arundo donax TaxID=35708 RepID=A0A0A8Y068_ARUDO